jgi:hypothetical protein
VMTEANAPYKEVQRKWECDEGEFRSLKGCLLVYGLFGHSLAEARRSRCCCINRVVLFSPAGSEEIAESCKIYRCSEELLSMEYGKVPMKS